jgi:hypothetical protein
MIASVYPAEQVENVSSKDLSSHPCRGINPGGVGFGEGKFNVLDAAHTRGVRLAFW